MINLKKKVLYIEPSANNNLNSQKNYLSRFKNPETEIEIISLSEAPKHLEYYSYHALVVPKILKIIKEAEKDKFDAAIIGCFNDPGLSAGREIAERLVVIGPGESSMHIAGTLGQRFSIIAARPNGITRMRENIVKYGFQNHLASFQSIGMGVIDLQVNPEETKKRIIKAAKKSIDQDAADVIILGCTQQFGFYQELQNNIEVPVIDVTLAALSYAEFLVDLRNVHGWYFNKKSLYMSPPHEEIETWNLSELD